MKLGQRLKQDVGHHAAGDGDVSDGPAVVSPPPPPPLLPRAEAPALAADPLGDLKQRAQQSLYSRLGARVYDASMTEEKLQTQVLQELGEVMREERAPLTPGERHRLVREISNDILGYGPIQQFLDDETITEVMVNGQASIYVERNGKLQRTGARFVSDDHLRRVIERIVSQIGRRIDESSPMVDARLPDGSRVNAIIPPLAVDGPSVSIRKFAKDPYQVPQLIRFGSMSAEIADLLRACVQGRLNILVTGGTGTGKTTMLNVLSSFIPGDERIVTVEDAIELQLQQDHVVRLESRPRNVEGKGEVTIRDLVRNSLRMRPDRIIVGEVRGGEALDMLQAMNTGHDGSLGTLHANSPRDALSRLETMVLMAGMDLPARAIREQAASAIDLIVHITRLRDGSRRITHISEVQGMEGQVITLSDIFTFDFAAGVDAEGRFRGTQRPTGIRPHFADKLRDYGIVIPQSTFGDSAAETVRALARDRTGLPR